MILREARALPVAAGEDYGWFKNAATVFITTARTFRTLPGIYNYSTLPGNSSRSTAQTATEGSFPLGSSSSPHYLTTLGSCVWLIRQIYTNVGNDEDIIRGRFRFRLCFFQFLSGTSCETGPTLPSSSCLISY